MERLFVWVPSLKLYNIAIENPQFWWYLPGKMGIFMGYVSFREGKRESDPQNPRDIQA